MASGALPKRVACPKCNAPQGYSCRDAAFKDCRPHAERQAVADAWYTTKSPDGLTPQRRDEMVEVLGDLLGRGKVAKAMERVTKAKDPEAEFARLSR